MREGVRGLAVHERRREDKVKVLALHERRRMREGVRGIAVHERRNERNQTQRGARASIHVLLSRDNVMS